METFAEVVGFPDYEVSSCGRVRTKERKIRYTHAVTKQECFRTSEARLLKEHLNTRTGYKFYQLYKNKKMHNCTAHRLVAMRFIPNPSGYDVVNHIDGNKHNNTVQNLEWCTNAYNHEHATKTGLKPHGSKVGSSKLNERAATAIRRMAGEGISHVRIAKWFDVSRATISLLVEGKTWNLTIKTGSS